MPSIFIVTSIDFSSLWCLLLIWCIFLSCAGLWTFTKFSLSAFETTQKLERLIAAAPNIGSRLQPNRFTNTPAASGIPIVL